MKGFWQAMALLPVCALTCTAEQKPVFEWAPPEVGKGMFSQELQMIGRERDDYASHLAAYASHHIIAQNASRASLEDGRRFIAVALHLSRRNRKAILASYKLSKGLLPEPSEDAYSATALSGLLMARGKLLAAHPGPENQLLARIFTEFAARLDSRNEDAIYEAEVHRIDHGPIPWDQIINFASKGEKP